MRLNSAKDLDVYKKAYALAMEIFRVSKGSPPEERYALTSQIRRSSRSVCLNLREAWAKRRYESHISSTNSPTATGKIVRPIHHSTLQETVDMLPQNNTEGLRAIVQR